MDLWLAFLGKMCYFLSIRFFCLLTHISSGQGVFIFLVASFFVYVFFSVYYCVKCTIHILCLLCCRFFFLPEFSSYNFIAIFVFCFSIFHVFIISVFYAYSIIILLGVLTLFVFHHCVLCKAGLRKQSPIIIDAVFLPTAQVTDQFILFAELLIERLSKLLCARF